MPNTSGSYPMPYPNSTAVPDVPGDVLLLAQEVDEQFTAIAGIRRYGNVAAINALASPRAHDRAVALDTGLEYRYSGSAWVLDDTGWITPTLNAGWTGTPSELPAYRRLNGVVYLSGRASTTATGAAAYELPVGFRPSGNVVGRTDANNVSFRYIIFATGGVGQASAANATAFSFGAMAAFVADA